MKKFIVAFAAGSILVLVLANGANAQNSDNVASPGKRESSFRDDKVNPPGSANGVEISISDVNAKALKHFRKAYKNASNEQWLKNEYGLAARFTSDNVARTVYFDNKGNWAGELKNYYEDKMDKEVRAVVKRTYYDYTISYVQEVETISAPGITAYMVHLDGAGDFKIVRVINGEMDVYKEYKKQK